MRPDELCAIMGPSGAGKSSLLNILAGRVQSRGNIKVTCPITCNGNSIDPLEFRTRVAYVMQEDALFATQTPREALMFSAALRLSRNVTEEQRIQLVDDMITALRLTKCQHTYIGSVMIKGISGGEKKRTAIGIELISNPSILFLDEPTSGLDSYAAFMVCKILRQLSTSQGSAPGCTVVCTIHQPSSEVFELFNKCILLANGRTVYNGGVDRLVEAFKGLGKICKPNYNPADFVMFVMQTTPDEELIQMGEALAMEDAPPESPHYRNSSTGDTAAPLEPKATLCTQAQYLFKREGLSIIRDKGALIARFAITIFINLLVGIIFMFSGSYNHPDTPDAVVVGNHFGMSTQVCIGAMFGLSQPLILAFPTERPVFLREYATGTYSAIIYFLAKLLNEIPMAIIQSTVIWTVSYFLVQAQGNFIELVLVTALFGLTAASTALVISAGSSNVQVAIQVTPLLFVPQLLFSGFFIRTSSIPSFMRWAQYLCSLKYALNLICIVEFHEVPEKFKQAVQDTIFTSNDIDKDNYWLYLGVLGGIFAVFRIGACILLCQKARSQNIG